MNRLGKWVCAAALGVSTAAAAEGWTFVVTPYLWGAVIAGDLATGGGTPIDAPDVGDDSFFDLENLDGAAFLAFEARHDRWRLLVDALQIGYSDTVRNGALLNVAAELDGYMLEGAAALQLRQAPDWEVLAGLRYFSVRTALDVQPGPQASVTKDWADPFIGARYTRALSERWSTTARLDVGGFGVHADRMINGAITAHYSLGERTALHLGYRYLSADFEDDGYRFDVSFRGPAIGFSFTF